MASLGQALEHSTHAVSLTPTMLLLCSHFTEEEIKAQRSLSNLHEIKHPIGGSSEGVSRWKVRFERGEQPGLSIDMGKNTARRKGREWVCWNDVWWGSWRGRRRADPDWSLFTSPCMLERHWRGLSKTHDQTWREQELEGWERGNETQVSRIGLCLFARASCKNAFNCSNLFCFPQKHRHDF